MYNVQYIYTAAKTIILALKKNDRSYGQLKIVATKA